MKPAVFLALALGFQVAAQDDNDRDSWIERILHDIREAVTCGGCEVVLGSLKALSGLGQDALIDVLTGVCTVAGIQDPDVCSGILDAEGPAVYTVLQNLDVGSHTSNTLCASLAGLCDYPEVREYNLTFPSPKPEKSRPQPSGQDPIRVAQISDTHVDLEYTPGSNYECSKPICCRVYDEDDAPGNTSSPCGNWGHSNCDPPLRLEESMISAIEEQEPSFSIYTGDVVPHDIWSVDKEETLDVFNATYSLFDRLGLVYSAVGNHDTAPANIFPATDDPANQWAYDALISDWQALAPFQSNNDQHGSYSSVHPSGGLRIISYNSVFYYTFNFAMYTDPMSFDPNSQFAWLISELDAAEKANQRAWLIAHIPSGGSDTFHDASHYFDQIVNRYEATIAALFFGHTHTDLLQISYSDYSNRNAETTSAVGYINPSLTPTSGPPSFRIYDIDPVTFSVLDYTQYIANITNLPPGAKPQWKKYYSAKQAYGSALTPPLTDPAAELTPSFWHSVTAAMENEEAVFKAWWARQTREFEVPECDESCKEEAICGMRGADAQFNCDKATPFSFSAKRDEVGGCDEGGSGLLLARLMGLGHGLRE